MTVGLLVVGDEIIKKGLMTVRKYKLPMGI